MNLYLICCSLLKINNFIKIDEIAQELNKSSKTTKQFIVVSPYEGIIKRRSKDIWIVSRIIEHVQNCALFKFLIILNGKFYII